MKWIVVAGLAGWSGIVALAWRLADGRIARCYYLENDCIVHATAARDATLIGGLTVALVALLAVAVLAVVRKERLKRSVAISNSPKKLS